jgi:hypothetical protein
MLHMGYVDEALFGYEVIERLPNLVKEWAEIAHFRTGESRADSPAIPSLSGVLRDRN